MDGTSTERDGVSLHSGPLLERFGRGGFVKLALRTGAPIIPVAIVGAEEMAPLFGKIPASFLGIAYLPLTPPPLPARWTIRFGDPISMGELPPEAADDMSQVQRLTERTRESSRACSRPCSRIAAPSSRAEHDISAKTGRAPPKTWGPFFFNSRLHTLTMNSAANTWRWLYYILSTTYSHAQTSKQPHPSNRK